MVNDYNLVRSEIPTQSSIYYNYPSNLNNRDNHTIDTIKLISIFAALIPASLYYGLFLSIHIHTGIKSPLIIHILTTMIVIVLLYMIIMRCIENMIQIFSI